MASLSTEVSEKSDVDAVSDKRVLIISHGHPDINPGGGEIAAYNLFEELNRAEGYESVFFARHQDNSRMHGGTTFSGTGSESEILFHVPMSDWFKFSQPDKPKVWRDFRETLELTKPDIVHFHHYVHLGLELFREVKNYSKDIPIVLTLHEYFGICHNHGQMVKRTDNSLCNRATPAECAACFPEYSPQDFFLRKQFIQSYFEIVDQFISPSEFLKNRYVEWGLPESKIKVIENIDGRPVEQATNRPTLNDPSQEKIRFAFFGQINWFKGVDVLIDAYNYLPEKLKKKVFIEINGSGLDHQPKEMQEYVRESIDRSGGHIRFKGRYQPVELGALMNSTDWVVIPSKWWENSPMVIMEAKKYGVPVICSNIGGMAEKVKHEKTGLHFQARRPDSLADQMIHVIQNPGLRESMIENIKRESDQENGFEEHLAIYESLSHDQAQTPVSTRLRAA